MERTTYLSTILRDKYAAMCAHLKATRPFAGDYSSERILGKVQIDETILDVIAKLETCGSSLRLFIMEGTFLRFTMRLIYEGGTWKAGDENAWVEMHLNSGKVRYEQIGSKHMETPENWIVWLYASMYSAEKVRRTTYAKGRIPLTAIKETV